MFIPSILFRNFSTPRGPGRRQGRGVASASPSSAFLSWNVESESVKSAEGSLLPTSEVKLLGCVSLLLRSLKTFEKAEIVVFSTIGQTL